MECVVGISAQQFAISQLIMKDYCERTGIKQEEVQKEFDNDVTLFTDVFKNLLFEDYGETPFVEVS